MKPVSLAIFASGSGTNAENLIWYFEGHDAIRVSAVFSNKQDAYVLQRAKNLGVPAVCFSKAEFNDPSFLSQLEGIDMIILAGFLWLIPAYLVDAFPDRIINIHPALLPRFGGKGMYGSRVHEAVLEAKEKESGITIHLVNREYDKGRVLSQATCEVTDDDTPDTLAARIHKLEYHHFPRVIEEYVLGL